MALGEPALCSLAAVRLYSVHSRSSRIASTAPGAPAPWRAWCPRPRVPRGPSVLGGRRRTAQDSGHSISNFRSTPQSLSEKPTCTRTRTKRTGEKTDALRTVQGHVCGTYRGAGGPQDHNLLSHATPGFGELHAIAPPYCTCLAAEERKLYICSRSTPCAHHGRHICATSPSWASPSVNAPSCGTAAALTRSAAPRLGRPNHLSSIAAFAVLHAHGRHQARGRAAVTSMWPPTLHLAVCIQSNCRTRGRTVD
eukprot:1737332-Prymnesium_polylepis.3